MRREVWFVDEIRGRRDILVNDVVDDDTGGEAPRPGNAVQFLGTIGDVDVGVDGIGETGHDGADGDREGKPSPPVPPAPVSVDAVGVVHISDIEFLVADKVEIGNEDTGNRTHEARIPGKECKELSSLDDDSPS